MNVLLNVAGHVEVDDVLHARDVKAPGSNSRGHYDGSLATFKSKTCVLIPFFIVIKHQNPIINISISFTKFIIISDVRNFFSIRPCCTLYPSLELFIINGSDRNN